MVVVLVIAYLSIDRSIYLFVCLSVCLPASLKTQQFCETSSLFELDNDVKNEIILGDFLFLNLITSKTKQFCQTSSIFEVDNIKNEAILRNLF